MKTLKQIDNDIYIDPTSKNVVWIQGKECLIQRIQNRLKMYKGEWVYSINDGIDWFALLQQRDKVLYENAIRDELLKDSEIIAVDNIQTVLVETSDDVTKYNKPKGTLILETIRIDSIYGEVTI